MTADQKRARAIIIITLVVIITVAIGLGWLLTSMGAPLWLALAITVVVGGALSLFMFLEMS